jgi:hypothetical protein
LQILLLKLFDRGFGLSQSFIVTLFKIVDHLKQRVDQWRVSYSFTLFGGMKWDVLIQQMLKH